MLRPYFLYILKILITSIAGHQFIVGSLFHNFSILDKQDLVYILNTVKRALTDLEQHGYLQKIPRYRDNGSSTSNLYSVQ